MALISKSLGPSGLAAFCLLGLLTLGACAAQEGPPAPRALARAPIGPDLAPPAALIAPPAPVPVIPVRLPPPPLADGLLAAPPADARPGECYAKVVVPGQPIAAPPAQPHAVWLQSPPRPGQAGPTWCLVYLTPAPQPVAWTPERHGWIRVICDKDATVERIRHIQRRLHAWGYYEGAYEGRYDEVTAHGVARFQARRRIEHGGILSLKTIDALDEAPPAAAPPPVAIAPLPPQIVQAPLYRQPMIVQQPVVAGCAQPACAQPGGYGWPQGYGPQAYGPTPPYRGAFLSWPGKSVY